MPTFHFISFPSLPPSLKLLKLLTVLLLLSLLLPLPPFSHSGLSLRSLSFCLFVCVFVLTRPLDEDVYKVRMLLLVDGYCAIFNSLVFRVA